MLYVYEIVSDVHATQEVGVHIADVTNFLAPGTPMDAEAAARYAIHFLSALLVNQTPGYT